MARHQRNIRVNPRYWSFVRGIHRWLVNSPHKGPVTRKKLPFDDVIINIEFAELALPYAANGQSSMRLHNYGSKQFHSSNFEQRKYAQRLQYAPWPMGKSTLVKCPWSRTTTSLDNSTQIRTDKIYSSAKTGPVGRPTRAPDRSGTTISHTARRAKGWKGVQMDTVNNIYHTW